jgi:hypothetical protein
MRYVQLGLLLAGCGVFVSCLGPPLPIVPAELPNAIEGTRYVQNLNTTESRSIQWEVSAGALPPGLSLDSETGAITGQPTLAGTHDFTVSVSEFLPRRVGTQAYTLVVLPRLVLRFEPTPARVDEAYDYTPMITGGVPPYAVSVKGLPAGLDYDGSTGRITGTPVREYDDLLLEASVTDRGDPQQADTAAASLVVHPVSVSITTTELPNAAVGEEYTAELEAENGLRPYRWSFLAGHLPNGLRLESSGRITGAPRVSATTETFTLAVTDADRPASSDSREFKLVVPVVITTTTLTAATVGVEYDPSVGVAGGLPPYTWELAAGELPEGIAFDPATGAFSGAPTAGATEQTFTIRVTDSDTPPTSAEQEFTIQVQQ